MKHKVRSWLLIDKKFILILFLSLGFIKLNAQVSNYFSKTFDLSVDFIDGFTSGIAAYNDTLVYIQGFEVKNDNSRPVFITCINLKSMDTLWVKKYGSSTEFHFRPLGSSLLILNNYIYCCGYYADTTSNNTHPYVYKFNLNGDTIWRKIYKNFTSVNNGFNSIRATRDQNLIIGGTGGILTSNLNFLLVKIDTSGNSIFTRNFGGGNNEVTYEIDTTQDGGFILGGYREVPGPIWQGYIVKADSLGNFEWEQLLSNDSPVWLKSLSNGNIVVYSGATTPNPSQRDGYVAIIDTFNGIIVKDQSYYFSDFDYTGFLGVVQSDENLFFIGNAWSNVINNPGGILLKTNLNLDSLASRWYIERTNDNYLNSLIKTNKDEFLMPGFLFPDGSGNSQDSWLLYTNCIGALEPPTAIAELNSNENSFQQEITLTNQSTEFDHCLINWQDGTLDTVYFEYDSLHTHQYALPGQYDITVSAIACNDTSIWQTTLTVLPNEYEGSLKVFPNPTNGNLNIWYPSMDAFTLRVFDDTGRLVKQENLNENTINNGYNVNLSLLSSGIYLLNLNSEGEQLSVKVVKTE